ncbi:MAG TPA: amidohydrolase family protein [Caulobacteraceae bacterium]|jgi:imidazolonepropionase-like amidohydrolase|nr:amidohydrolase family protein [Caulobacteraceae bacterium]
MNPAPTETIIHAGRLLAEPGQAPSGPGTLRIAEGKIAAIAEGFVEPPEGAQVIDLKDRFVLPGLIDCHVHLTMQLGPGERLALVEDSDPKVGLDGAHRAGLTLAAGFTTVRDLGAHKPEVIYALRAATAEGKVPGPRILAVGAILSPTGGHGGTYGFRRDVCMCVQSSIGTCDGADGCMKAVRAQVAEGADAIKFAATGGVLSNIKAGIDQQFTTQELTAIIETAHRLGRRVSAHAHGTGGINAALMAGVDSIEHGSFLDEDSIRLFLEHGAFHTPTLIAGATVLGMAQDGLVLTPAQREKALVVGEAIIAALSRSYKAGVKISFGTDMGVGPHGQNGREFALMTGAGMSNADAIKAATVTAAELLDISNVAGRLRVGMSADVIAVAGDPLTDITELERVKFVMAAGTIH